VHRPPCRSASARSSRAGTWASPAARWGHTRARLKPRPTAHPPAPFPAQQPPLHQHLILGSGCPADVRPLQSFGGLTCQGFEGRTPPPPPLRPSRSPAGHSPHEGGRQAPAGHPGCPGLRRPGRGRRHPTGLDPHFRGGWALAATPAGAGCHACWCWLPCLLALAGAGACGRSCSPVSGLPAGGAAGPQEELGLRWPL